MFKLFFLGAGKMATAIAGGIVKAGVFQKSELAAFDVSAKAAQEFEEKTGVHCYSGGALNEGIAQAEAVLLAVKPQVLASALEPLAGALAGKPVISIVAGVPIDRFGADCAGHAEHARAGGRGGGRLLARPGSAGRRR